MERVGAFESARSKAELRPEVFDYHGKRQQNLLTFRLVSSNWLMDTEKPPLKEAFRAIWLFSPCLLLLVPCTSCRGRYSGSQGERASHSQTGIVAVRSVPEDRPLSR